MDRLIHADELSARVAAVNRAHAVCNDLYPRIRDAIKPFIGRPIHTKTGDLRADVEKAIGKLPGGPGLQCFPDRYACIFGIDVKTCEHYRAESHYPSDYNPCLYYDAGITVGLVEDGILESIRDYEPLRSDYTVAEVRKLRDAYIAADRALTDARVALVPFPHR